MWFQPRAASEHSLVLTLGAGSVSSHLTHLLSSPPPKKSCWCGVFSKMPGYSRISSSQTDVESSFNLHPQAVESGLTPESGVWLVTWLEYLHLGEGGWVNTLGKLILHFSVSAFTPMVLDTPPPIVSASFHPHLNPPPSLPLSHEYCSELCGSEFWILGGRRGEDVSIFGVLVSVDQRVPGSMTGWSSEQGEAPTGAPGFALFQ